MGIMAPKPCDTCKKECVGGIIYGNCQQYLEWRRELNHIDICLESFFSLSRSSATSE